MGYRFCDNPPKPEDYLPRFAVRNGAVLTAAFGCYYLKGHNPKLHDHIGWPNPEHPDMICQELSNMKLYGLKCKTAELEKIDLKKEGYNQVGLAFDDDTLDLESLHPECWIADDDINIIKIKLYAHFPIFEDYPKDLKFTLFVAKDNELAIDAVCRGVITVLPGSSDVYIIGE